MGEPEMHKPSDDNQTRSPPTTGFCFQHIWKTQNDRDRKQKSGSKGLDLEAGASLQRGIGQFVRMIELSYILILMVVP